MHKLFIDVNVILDVATGRSPHHESSCKVLTRLESKKAIGYVSSVSYPILHYLLSKDIGQKKATDYLKDLFRLVSIVEVNKKTLERGMELGLKDFEDGLQMACAEACSADYLVTRNAVDYKNSPIFTVTPAEYLATFPLG